jgi:hypothetical protein
MSGPVHWGSYPGEFLEQVMAVLTAQDHPHLIRRSPSQGDAGVDLLLPNADGYVVQQVKRFSGRLTNSQRGQIKDSWETFRANAQVGRPVTAYELVLPLDPTQDEQDWFEGLTDDAPFPCRWLGEVYWNVLAARYPHVLDYYINGQRDRINQRHRAIVAGMQDPTRPYTAEDAAGSLTSIMTALDRDDPHYHYDLKVTVNEPSVADAEGYMLCETRRLDDGRFLTVGVRPKHDYADRDAPMGGTLTIRFPPPEEVAGFREDFLAFQQFGRALDVPDGYLDSEMIAPGGMSTTVIGGGGWIGPNLATDAPERWRIAITNPSGDDLIELPMTTVTLTRSHVASGGAELTVTHGSGALEAVLQLVPGSNDGPRVELHALGLDGKPVLEVIEVARFLARCEGSEPVRVAHGIWPTSPGPSRANRCRVRYRWWTAAPRRPRKPSVLR